jgi:hypothetical protein
MSANDDETQDGEVAAGEADRSPDMGLRQALAVALGEAPCPATYRPRRPQPRRPESRRRLHSWFICFESIASPPDNSGCARSAENDKLG